jgi:Mg-chelatase subunit ChlD
MELYHGARETCLRLYVANGGDPRAQWTIRPYPGTAAIACNMRNGVSHFTLCMPAFPLNVRLPRWKSTLVAAYTVHELLHSLWTDWHVVAQSSREGLHGLTNALEDNRIEAKATRGDLVQVSEARRLLEALNAHIAQRALNTPGFTLDSPAQFSFVLGLVIFAEKLGYASQLPADWRAAVRPEWLPLFDLALARFDGLRSTADTLQLARDLKALAAALPKPAKPKAVQDMRMTQPMMQPPQGDMGEGQTPHEPEIVESDDDVADVPPTPTPSEASQEPAGEPDAPEHGDDADAGEPLPAPSSEPVKAKPEGEADNNAKSGDAAGAAGEREPEPEPEPEPAEDVTDNTQTYAEANLDDLAQEAAKEAGKMMFEVNHEGHNASVILNAPTLADHAQAKGGDPKRAGAAITSPAKLRRHLTLAVKSPERVGTERRQVSGRLDMRNRVGIASGAANVFKRRIEEEGREAAVTLLLDISGSMKGAPLAAAKALALHMGDALKAAGVRFEVCGFDDAHLVTPKPFAQGWARETQRAVAGIHAMGGTSMLPAMKQCAERLLKQGNVTRRILITLTDGADTYTAEQNAALCSWYRQRGVEIIGIGLYVPNVAKSFCGRAISVTNLSQLSTLGMAQLVKVLDQA